MLTWTLTDTQDVSSFLMALCMISILCMISGLTFCYCIVPGKCPHPILTVQCSFEVLHVTAHHDKFFCSESNVGLLISHT